MLSLLSQLLAQAPVIEISNVKSIQPIEELVWWFIIIFANFNGYLGSNDGSSQITINLNANSIQFTISFNWQHFQLFSQPEYLGAYSTLNVSLINYYLLGNVFL